MMAALEQLEAEGRLPIRVYAMLSLRDEPLMHQWIERGPDSDTDGMLVTRSVKAYYDGALGSHCVARCEAAGDCTADPWLACEAPGAGGSRGFSVDETAATLGYCAPKSCMEPTDCGPDGTCSDGYCAPD